MKKFFLLVALVLMILSSGCTKKVDLGPGYERMSKDFLQAMRWKDFEGAAAYLEEGHRQDMLVRFSESRDLHIVGAAYQYSRLNKKMGAAQSEMILEYYLLPSTRVQEWVWKMDWVLIPAGTKQRGIWQVQGVPPAFP